MSRKLWRILNVWTLKKVNTNKWESIVSAFWVFFVCFAVDLVCAGARKKKGPNTIAKSGVMTIKYSYDNNTYKSKVNWYETAPESRLLHFQLVNGNVLTKNALHGGCRFVRFCGTRHLWSCPRLSASFEILWEKKERLLLLFSLKLKTLFKEWCGFFSVFSWKKLVWINFQLKCSSFLIDSIKIYASTLCYQCDFAQHAVFA